MSDDLDFLVDLLDLEPIEVNIFRGVSPNEDRQRVFGGQVAAQSLMAAGRTVDIGRPHSLHAYFLRPGDPTVPILYEVDRIRDGRSFTTRRVVAIQHGRAIFNLSASFHVDEAGLCRTRFPMPEVPAPEELDSLVDRLEPYRETLGDWFDRPHPSTSATSASCPFTPRSGQGARPAPVDPGRRHPPRRSAAPRLHRRLCLGHVAVRHHARPPRGAAGTTPSSWAPASTTACGSTARSGPTSGCSTTWTARRLRRPGPGPRVPVHQGGRVGRVDGPGGPHATVPISRPELTEPSTQRASMGT